LCDKFYIIKRKGSLNLYIITASLYIMKLSISRCSSCSHVRLVDKVKEQWVCFACKQKVKTAIAS